MISFMNKSKIINDPFIAALDFCMRMEKITQAELAESVGYKQNSVSALLKGKTQGSPKKRQAIVNFFKYKYSDFISLGEKQLSQTSNDEQHMPTPQPCQECANIQDEFMSKHFEVVKEFKDREWALKANQTLVMLERIAPEQKEMALRLLNTLILEKPHTLNEKKTG